MYKNANQHKIAELTKLIAEGQVDYSPIAHELEFASIDSWLKGEYKRNNQLYADFGWDL